MGCEVSSGRFTSKDILVQYLPCGAAASHVQKLTFQPSLTGGTFKLRVNGELTAAITYSDTGATLLTNINTALDALPSLANGDIVATGDNLIVTLTAIANKWYTIELVDISGLTGNTSSDPAVVTEVTTQGSKLYTLSGQVSSFDYEVTAETVDATAISEYAATEIPVKETMTFSLNVYKAEEDWRWAVRAGKRGILYVYETGKFVGRPYFAFYALFDKVSVSFPDHELVEAEMTGKRQGAMVVDFDSVYA
jgi:hypothetical protein